MTSFTSSLKIEDEQNLSAEVQAALEMLREAFKQPIEARTWSENYIAIPLRVGVELPSRGPVGNVDIRPEEDIFLLLHRRYYPNLAPTVRSNRKDFPKSKFPHNKPNPKGKSAHYILHRGSLDAWFAEHTIVDLVNRGREWLRDAARNRLIPEGDVFERTLVAETYGTFIYAPALFLGEIAGMWACNGGAAGSGIVAYDLLDDEKAIQFGNTGYSVASVKLVYPSAVAAHLELARLLNEAVKIPDLRAKYQRRLFGLLLWPEEGTINANYFGEFPETLDEFVGWAESLGLPATTAFDHYLAQDLHLFAGVPVTIAVRRPATIIGTQSDIELINFLVIAGGDHWPKDGRWDRAAVTWVSDHRAPLTTKFARKVSALDETVEIDKTMILGCGALGSKIALHFGRSGEVNLTLVDHGILSPHNLVRHALEGAKVGQSKAQATRDAILRIYPAVEELPVSAHDQTALDFISGDKRALLAEHKHLIDATASQIVFNSLCSANASQRASRMPHRDRRRRAPWCAVS